MLVKMFVSTDRFGHPIYSANKMPPLPSWLQGIGLEVEEREIVVDIPDRYISPERDVDGSIMVGHADRFFPLYESLMTGQWDEPCLTWKGPRGGYAHIPLSIVDNPSVEIVIDGKEGTELQWN